MWLNKIVSFNQVKLDPNILTVVVIGAVGSQHPCCLLSVNTFKCLLA